jgi:hypothetical protein
MDPKRPLSEISHLFLSEIRARQPGGPRPSRVPPPKGPVLSDDLTPEEFAASFTPETALPSHPACISVVLSAHLMEQGATSVRQYARHLAAESGRIGLIEADSAEFTVTCFEKDDGPATSPLSIDAQDARKISETLNELTYDVDRWLICLPNARSPESRELLRAAPHWVMLTTANDDGVVAAYRALKGLSELGQRRVSLVVLDARDEAHAAAVFRKLDGVSRQFLHSGLETGSLLRPAQNISENALLHCRQPANQPVSEPALHWRIIRDLMSTAVAPTPQQKSEPPKTMKLNIPENPKMPAIDKMLPEVIELPGDAGERSILDSVVRQGGADGRWITCPIHPPMCPEALLAVGRDQRLMLLAIAGRGLSQLLSIGQSHRWMSENGELIRMALPQLAIDTTLTPAVVLLVDHSDLSAEILQPLLQTGTVTVQAYRKVKWGAKTGLLLEAA